MYVVLFATQENTHTRTGAKHQSDTSYGNRAAVAAAVVAAAAAHRQSRAKQDLPRFRHVF